MKKITQLFSIAMLLLFTNNVTAQQETKAKKFKQNVNANKPKLTPEQKASKNADTLKVALSLNNDQYTKVLATNTTYFTKMEGLKKMAKSDTTGLLKMQIKTLHAERETNLKTILTAEQYNQLLARRKSKKSTKSKPAKNEVIPTGDLDE